MATLPELGTYIDSDTSLTIGVDLFLGLLPEEPDACVAIFETTPGSVMETMRTTAPSLEMPRIQAIIRGQRNSYATTRATAETVWRSVSKIQNTTLSGVQWLRAIPVDTPSLMGRDDDERPLFTVNFEIVKALS